MPTVGGYRKAGKTDSFQSEVRRRFGPMAAKWGMSGPVDDEVVIPSVTYQSAGLAYRWLHDPSDHAIIVHVVLHEEGVRRSASLDELVVAAGLGAPQHVRTGATTWRALQQAIESQAEWLERLHPRLSGPEAAAFLDESGAAKHQLGRPE
jgi:hypothetical protein